MIILVHIFSKDGIFIYFQFTELKVFERVIREKEGEERRVFAKMKLKSHLDRNPFFVRAEDTM